ncbi:uncharacterized protein LOC115885001 [Sitophilus oryzae]|uniref:Uncharacterized protein LOC115885001 n=1 Tax=Sitophilus oryzae TaxID=7048 RepID=A0A6J2Y8P9_SITOR|nr:uncharacterized protein LOC115885001 [Sitophilus oryzae]
MTFLLVIIKHFDGSFCPEASPLNNMFRQLFVIIVIFCLLTDCDSEHHLSKRSFYLLFPRNTVLQFTYGLSVPFILPRRSINLTWGFQSQYNLPKNISDFVPNTIAVRSNTMNFDLPRVKFYDYLSKILTSFGLHGRQCIYRSICEIAEIPMYKKDDSTLERIVEFLFTPSLDLEKTNSSVAETESYQSGFTKKILRAEDVGKKSGHCDEKYSKCIISLVDLITVLYVT